MAKKILAVDDEKHIVRLVQINLEKEGYEVATANTGREALEKVASFQPDLIVMDVMMPEMDGLEALSRLKADPVTSGIPIVIMSSVRSNSLKRLALEAGAADVLSKNLPLKEVMGRILEAGISSAHSA